jgi:hypothetical protein
MIRRGLCCLVTIGFAAALQAQERPRAHEARPRPGSSDAWRAVTRALKLLPRQPEAVVLIDVRRSPPALQARLHGVAGFVTPGDRTVYLNGAGLTLRGAVRKGNVWDCALAAIIWHEMAHVDGADEREARREEEELWRRFIVEGRVDASRGLNYLQLLRARLPPPTPQPRR